MRTLKLFKEVYAPKSPDEDNFVRKHIVKKTEDKNGNKDDVFNATNVKAVDREKQHHGYNTGNDEKVYEAKMEKCSECGKKHEGTCANESVAFKQVKKLTERHMTAGEKKKREEIARAIEREHPDMPMSKKMAIATARAMGEETENLEEGAQEQYDHYHKQARTILSKIGKALDDHQKAAKSHKMHVIGFEPQTGPSQKSGAHWGHVGELKDIHRQLEDLHDRLVQAGEYAK